MKGVKEILIQVAIVAAGVAVWEMLGRPLVNKAKTMVPGTSSATATK